MSFVLHPSPIFRDLLGDPEIECLLSIDADIQQMLRFEIALAEVEAEVGVIPEAAAQNIGATIAQFKPDLVILAGAVRRDGLCVPGLIRQLKDGMAETDAQWLHFGATSQDLIDTSLILRLRQIVSLLAARLNETIDVTEKLVEEHGKRPLMGRTRMQAALPIVVGDRVNRWLDLLRSGSASLEDAAARLNRVQFAGPVGTLDKLAGNGPAVRAGLAEKLDLDDPGRSWHSVRTDVANFASALSVITGVLGKIGRDLTLMAQQTPQEVRFSGGGSSSAMPHKQNPVRAEILITQAHMNAQALAGMHSTLVHEQERSGAMWTLEWLLLPQMCVTTGAALNNALAQLGAVEQLGADG